MITLSDHPCETGNRIFLKIIIFHLNEGAFHFVFIEIL